MASTTNKRKLQMNKRVGNSAAGAKRSSAPKSTSRVKPQNEWMLHDYANYTFDRQKAKKMAENASKTGERLRRELLS